MPPLQPPKAANGAWFTPSMALGQLSAVQASSLPVAQFSTSFEPGMITAPHLPITFEVAGSIESVPTSPQSRLRAQRPETKSGRVSETSMLSSFGGPYFVVSLRKSSALRKASLLTSGRHVAGVEEGALAGALGLGHRADNVGDEPVALGVALLGDAGAEVGRAVAVHVLAVERLGDREILVPGLGRLEARRPRGRPCGSRSCGSRHRAGSM